MAAVAMPLNKSHQLYGTLVRAMAHKTTDRLYIYENYYFLAALLVERKTFPGDEK